MNDAVNQKVKTFELYYFCTDGGNGIIYKTTEIFIIYLKTGVIPAEAQVHNLYVTQIVNFDNQEKSWASDSQNLAIPFNIFVSHMLHVNAS